MKKTLIGKDELSASAAHFNIKDLVISVAALEADALCTLSKVLEPTKMTIVFRQEAGMMSTETHLELGIEPL